MPISDMRAIKGDERFLKTLRHPCSLWVKPTGITCSDIYWGNVDDKNNVVRHRIKNSIRMLIPVYSAVDMGANYRYLRKFHKHNLKIATLQMIMTPFTRISLIEEAVQVAKANNVYYLDNKKFIQTISLPKYALCVKVSRRYEVIATKIIRPSSID